ncbi:hypothetical protein [Paenibacillus sp. RU4X]|uniref:hypothetical protein n=1 Tax=Paenibacillus sp. RU4X TaxID=1907395 RepID=UPI001115683D|nr:hypothetical protein [Paenibacillus sp. RU4X]
MKNNQTEKGKDNKNRYPFPDRKSSGTARGRFIQKIGLSFLLGDIQVEQKVAVMIGKQLPFSPLLDFLHDDAASVSFHIRLLFTQRLRPARQVCRSRNGIP